MTADLRPLSLYFAANHEKSAAFLGKSSISTDRSLKVPPSTRPTDPGTRRKAVGKGRMYVKVRELDLGKSRKSLLPPHMFLFCPNVCNPAARRSACNLPKPLQSPRPWLACLLWLPFCREEVGKCRNWPLFTGKVGPKGLELSYAKCKV